MEQRRHCPRPAKLPVQGRVTPAELFPKRLEVLWVAVGQAGSLRAIAPSTQQEAGAHHPVIEGQLVHPPLLQEMMAGGEILGIGSRAQPRRARRRRGGEAGDLSEVAREQSRGDRHAIDHRGERQATGQKAVAAGSIDHELGLDGDRLAQSPAAQHHAGGSLLVLIENRAIPEDHSGRHRPSHQVGVNILTQPVGIGHRLFGARRNQQARFVGQRVAIELTATMLVEAEASLQATTKMRVNCAPPAVGGQGSQVGHSVALGQPLQRDRR